MEKPILFIGRFQPFHGGHLKAVRQLVEEHGTVLLGIGSANEARTPHNPFSYEERLECITAALKAEGIAKRVKIIPISDLHHNERWANHVLGLVEKHGGVKGYVSNNPWVAECINGHLKRFSEPELLHRAKLEGTKIRDQIRRGDERWKTSLHPAVVKVLERLDARKILLEVASHGHA